MAGRSRAEAAPLQALSRDEKPLENGANQIKGSANLLSKTQVLAFSRLPNNFLAPKEPRAPLCRRSQAQSLSALVSVASGVCVRACVRARVGAARAPPSELAYSFGSVIDGHDWGPIAASVRPGK